MNLTLHLTNKCNLICKYCFVSHGVERMSREVAFAAVDFCMQNENMSGLLFYGGEPLLERQLIYDTVNYTKSIGKKLKHAFNYKMTTNGVLLDEEFLKFAKGINLAIGFSHDGPAQDDCRRFPGGEGTFALLEDKIPLFSFSVEGVHATDMATLLDKMGYAVRSGQMCAEPALARFGQTSLLRASFAMYNTEEELAGFTNALQKTITMLR